MNKIKTIGLLALVIVSASLAVSFTSQTANTCNSVEIRKQARELFKPDFHYDASKSTYITFMNKKQFKELEVPLYIGEKYKIVFNTSSLPQGVDIEVYDKKYSAGNRTRLYTSKDAEEVKEGVLVFTPEKRMRKMYIDYTIPPTTGEVEKGCIIVTLGYKI